MCRRERRGWAGGPATVRRAAGHGLPATARQAPSFASAAHIILAEQCQMRLGKSIGPAPARRRDACNSHYIRFRKTD